MVEIWRLVEGVSLVGLWFLGNEEDWQFFRGREGSD